MLNKCVELTFCQPADHCHKNCRHVSHENDVEFKSLHFRSQQKQIVVITKAKIELKLSKIYGTFYIGMLVTNELSADDIKRKIYVVLQLYYYLLLTTINQHEATLALLQSNIHNLPNDNEQPINSLRKVHIKVHEYKVKIIILRF